MRALMYSCINWDYTKCNVKVSQLARWSIEGGEKEISYWPFGPEVIPYNEICRVCGNRQFEIREKRCNACESTDIWDLLPFLRRISHFIALCRIMSCFTHS